MTRTPDLETIRAFLDPTHYVIAEEAARFAGRAVASLPHARNDAAARIQARELMAAIGDASLYGPIKRLDLRGCCLVRETLAACSPLADAVYALQALGAVPLLLAGSDEQRVRWMEPALEGRAMAAFAMTEPDAGSDVASMQAAATRDGDGWTLNGRKTFISNAGIADFYTVFASTDPAAGAKGIGCFIVPTGTPGLRFVEAQVMSAPHPLGEIAFERCRIPGDHLVGEVGAGFRVGMATLDLLRCTVAAAACGMAGRALDEALGHARRRRQFGKPIAEFQLIQEKLSRMATELTAARLLTYRAAWTKDRGAERVTMEAAMAKAYATEAAQRIIDDAVQVLGGRGVLADSAVDLLYRSIRALRIYEGTTEVQHLVIAGRLLKAEP